MAIKEPKRPKHVSEKALLMAHDLLNGYASRDASRNEVYRHVIDDIASNHPKVDRALAAHLNDPSDDTRDELIQRLARHLMPGSFSAAARASSIVTGHMRFLEGNGLDQNQKHDTDPWKDQADGFNG